MNNANEPQKKNDANTGKSQPGEREMTERRQHEPQTPEELEREQNAAKQRQPNSPRIPATEQ